MKLDVSIFDFWKSEISHFGDIGPILKSKVKLKDK